MALSLFSSAKHRRFISIGSAAYARNIDALESAADKACEGGLFPVYFQKADPGRQVLLLQMCIFA